MKTILLLFSVSGFTLDLTFHVHETTGNAVASYPVTLVIPLPEGQYTGTAPFRVTDGGGSTVPAQISVLNKQWALGYIRHLLVTLQTPLSANEKRPFHLRDDGGNTAPSTPVTLTETGTAIMVATGPLAFRVKKQNFNLFDEVTLNGQQVIAPSADNGGILTDRNGGIQKSSDVAAPTVTVEESGPLRAIIKVEAPTIFTSTTDLRHGYAVRIYAYAGQPFVRVEYTLKNSAANVSHSWPLYARDFSVRTRLSLTGPTLTLGRETDSYSQALGSGAYVFQKLHNQFDVATSAGGAISSGAKAGGWMDASDGSGGVTVCVRNFWELWPNGLEIDGNKDLYVRMLPKWEAGYYWSGGFSRTPFSKSSSGLHWLDDMQHLTKEILYDFHGSGFSAAAAAAQAKRFQKPPVGVVPTAWYASTRVTADMGGYLPFTAPAASPNNTDLDYFSDPMTNIYYGFGWPNYMGNPYNPSYLRLDRHASCEPGETPAAGYRFMATENPKYYYQDEALVWGDLNVRPQWMGAEFNFNTGKNIVHDLTSVAYVPAPNCNYSWREYRTNFTGDQETFKIVSPYLPGTSHHGWTSRDEQHMWWYHMSDFYFYSGMPILKDWYRFLGEYQKFRVHVGYYYDRELGHGNTRTYGQALYAMAASYRITGDTSYLNMASIYAERLRKRQNRQYGPFVSGSGTDAGLMIGFLTRGLIHYMEELPSKSCKEYVTAFGVVEGAIEWNYNQCNWCYSNTADQVNTSMGGTAMPLADPQVWFYLHTGRTRYRQDAKAYADAKIYGDLLKWNLNYDNFPVWNGRLTQYEWDNPKSDTVPPAVVSDLSGQGSAPAGGGKLSVRADGLPSNTTLYFALRAFDSNDNMSAISNVYSVNPGSATTHFLTWTAPADAQYYHVRYYTKPIREATLADTSAAIHFWAALPVGNDINAPSSAEAFSGVRGDLSLSAFPNPFHGTVSLLISGTGAAVYDLRGRRVKRLALSGGRALWDGEDESGCRLSGGVYLISATDGFRRLDKKVTLLR